MTSMTKVPVRRRLDRTGVVAGLAGTTAIAWILTVQLANGSSMPVASMDMASAMPISMAPLWTSTVRRRLWGKVSGQVMLIMIRMPPA